ncbi:hypothetical protein J6590_033312 [Homalodisca vitripennis]|nr:hypothetical protein J6590_033312 [Homalodisca vitripennis]
MNRIRLANLPLNISSPSSEVAGMQGILAYAEERSAAETDIGRCCSGRDCHHVDGGESSRTLYRLLEGFGSGSLEPVFGSCRRCG